MTKRKLDESLRLVKDQFGGLKRTNLDHLTHVHGIAVEAMYVEQVWLWPRERVWVETFIQNVQYDDFPSYTTAVRYY